MVVGKGRSRPWPAPWPVAVSGFRDRAGAQTLFADAVPVPALAADGDSPRHPRRSRSRWVHGGVGFQPAKTTRIPEKRPHGGQDAHRTMGNTARGRTGARAVAVPAGAAVAALGVTSLRPLR